MLDKLVKQMRVKLKQLENLKKIKSKEDKLKKYFILITDLKKLNSEYKKGLGIKPKYFNLTSRDVALHFVYPNSIAFKNGIKFKNCIVHHINGEDIDYIENLYVCSNQKEHVKIHIYQKNNQMLFKNLKEIENFLK